MLFLWFLWTKDALTFHWIGYCFSVDGGIMLVILEVGYIGFPDIAFINCSNCNADTNITSSAIKWVHYYSKFYPLHFLKPS